MRYRWLFVIAGYALYYLGLINYSMLGALIVVVIVLHLSMRYGIIAPGKKDCVCDTECPGPECECSCHESAWRRFTFSLRRFRGNLFHSVP